MKKEDNMLKTRQRRRGVALLLGATVCATMGFAVPTATPANALEEQDATTLAPAYISGLLDPEGDELGDVLPPTSANIEALLTEEDETLQLPDRPSNDTQHDRALPPTTGCSADLYESSTGQALIRAVKDNGVDCINSLFNVGTDQGSRIFSEAQMLTVAEELQHVASSYPGNNSTQATELVLFLRAGYYVQYYSGGVIPPYGAPLRTAVGHALDIFFAHPRSHDVNDANGETLSEAVILIDSAELNDRYLDVVQRLLKGYDAQYNSSWWMLNAVNNTYTVLFRGHQVPAFVDAVAQNPTILYTLKEFALTHLDLLGGDNSYLVSNAGSELGRFLGNNQTRDLARPLVKELLDRSSLTGPTSSLWVSVAEMADWYDNSNCEYYGVCGFKDELEQSVLITSHDCSESVRIRAQDMNANELQVTCDSLLGQDAYFHNVAQDTGPVSGDVNTNIEVVVFDSSADYQAYAGALFGIDTNNGGMYLEGNPSNPNNQARFIAYEADWVRPAFEIWNLNHEYTHYLDGRFNMFGDFSENMLTPTIWWVEGFAEYISYHYRGIPYTAAQHIAANGGYALSELFNTTYDHDTDRIYRGGYLAVSFMLNAHPAELQTVLNFYRTGAWHDARWYLTHTIGSAYDAEFQTFLAECADGNCSADLGGQDPVDPGNTAPTASFGVTVADLTATFTNLSTDPDGEIVRFMWDFGDGDVSDERDPVKTYQEEGTYTVTLTVEDDKGATASTSQAVTVALEDPTPEPEPAPREHIWEVPICGEADSRMLGQACGRMFRASSKGDTDHLLMWIPEGTPKLTITTGGGEGEMDLYLNPYGWASPGFHTHRSTLEGTGEQIVINWPAAGWNYIALYAVEDYSDVSVVAHY